MCFTWAGKFEAWGLVRLSTRITSCGGRAFKRVMVFCGSLKIVGIMIESFIF